MLMRRLLVAALAALSLATLAGETQTLRLEVSNMTCALCPITVKKALEQVCGVSAVEVDFSKKTATVSFDPATTTPQALTEATTNAGYPSTVRKEQRP